MELKLKNISKSYRNYKGGEMPVIKDFSIELKSGSVLRLKGASGSGKSTLLNIISGLILPDKGAVILNGKTINNLNESSRDNFRAENIGYIFQTFNLLSPFSVIENVYAPSAFAGTLKSDYHKKATDVLKEVGLEGHENHMPFHLSVGQRQRVAVARVLFTEYPLILADEPTASLDRVSSETVLTALMKCRENGSTVVFASHDPAFDALKPDVVYDLESGGAI
jgi:ABC-type lipoprotein export system ATPase subunit